MFACDVKKISIYEQWEDNYQEFGEIDKDPHDDISEELFKQITELIRNYEKIINLPTVSLKIQEYQVSSMKLERNLLVKVLMDNPNYKTSNYYINYNTIDGEKLLSDTESLEKIHDQRLDDIHNSLIEVEDLNTLFEYFWEVITLYWVSEIHDSRRSAMLT